MNKLLIAVIGLAFLAVGCSVLLQMELENSIA